MLWLTQQHVHCTVCTLHVYSIFIYLLFTLKFIALFQWEKIRFEHPEKKKRIAEKHTTKRRNILFYTLIRHNKKKRINKRYDRMELLVEHITSIRLKFNRFNCNTIVIHTHDFQASFHTNRQHFLVNNFKLLNSRTSNGNKCM